MARTNAAVAIQASAHEAEVLSRDRLAEDRAVRRLQGAQSNLAGIKRQLADHRWAGSWHLLEEELPDAEWEVRDAERDLAEIRAREDA